MLKPRPATVDSYYMHSVPSSPPTLGPPASPPRPIIPQDEVALSAVSKAVPTVRTGPVLLWLVTSGGVMFLTPYIAFITLIVLYGWEDPGLLEGDGTLPIAIVLCALVYLAACLAPVFAGRWAFPRNRAAATIFGLLTPVLGVGAWLMILGASQFPNLGW